MTDPFDRRTGAPTRAPATPDPAFAARSRLARLRDALARAVKTLRPARWNEPAVFFFDRKRQAELDAVRPVLPGPFPELTSLISAELPALVTAVEVRRVARATVGLAEAAAGLASRCAAARDLADLLAIPDDEVFLALAPAERTGVRLHLRGATDVAQLHRLLVNARREPNPPTPFPEKEGGAGLTAGLSPLSPWGRGLGEGSLPSFQLLAPSALRPDGTLPTGFTGCEHWLWPTQPLAAVPRIGGERIVLMGPAVVRSALDVEPRFPDLAVECETVQTLNAFQTAEALSRLCGCVVPVQAPTVPVARAA